MEDELYYKIKSKINDNNRLFNKKKLSRYDSAIILKNDLNKKKIKLKNNFPVRKIELLFPSKNLNELETISNSNISKFRAKSLYIKRSTPQLYNHFYKFMKNNSPKNKIKLLNFNKINNENKNIRYKSVNSYNERFYNEDKNKLIKSFYNLKKNKSNNFIENNFNKNSKTEKLDNIKKITIPKINSYRNTRKKKLPINTLKHFHRYLFHNNKSICNCYEEEKEKNNNNQSYNNSTQNNNNIFEYEILELDGKKNYIATKVKRNRNDKNSPISLNIKKDYHYIMKHPLSNTFYCSTLVNQIIDKNNSYTNNYSDKFINLSNPLNDKDLINKLHNLILNPNTSKIRNGELLLMYKNFPKGTFYNILGKNNKANYENEKYNEELKKLENTKFQKYIIKLNKSMEKAKNIQKQLDILLSINKSSLENYNK